MEEGRKMIEGGGCSGGRGGEGYERAQRWVGGEEILTSDARPGRRGRGNQWRHCNQCQSKLIISRFDYI